MIFIFPVRKQVPGRWRIISWRSYKPTWNYNLASVLYYPQVRLLLTCAPCATENYVRLLHFTWPFVHPPIPLSSLYQTCGTAEHLPRTHLSPRLRGWLCSSPQWQTSGSLPWQPQWCFGEHAEEAGHSLSGRLEWVHPGSQLGSDPEHPSGSTGPMGPYWGRSHKELGKTKMASWSWFGGGGVDGEEQNHSMCSLESDPQLASPCQDSRDTWC